LQDQINDKWSTFASIVVAPMRLARSGLIVRGRWPNSLDTDCGVPWFSWILGSVSGAGRTGIAEVNQMPETAANLVSLLFLGFLLGIRHATDADHIVAIATIVSRQRNLRGSAMIGAVWGSGIP
jgi:hypothetical protein